MCDKEKTRFEADKNASLKSKIKSFPRIRSLVRILSIITQVSAAVLGVAGCEPQECFQERIFINFDGQTIPCATWRHRRGEFPYDFDYYCGGDSGDGNANATIEPYQVRESYDSEEAGIEALAAEKAKITDAIRAQLEQLGIEVFTDDALLSDGANVLNIGGTGEDFTEYVSTLGVSKMRDPGNQMHNNSAAVVQFPDGGRNILSTQNIVLISLHEIGHMLGLDHVPEDDPHSIMVPASELDCHRGLNPDEAEVLAKNLEGACNNQGVPFYVLEEAAELGSEGAIQACLDLKY